MNARACFATVAFLLLAAAPPAGAADEKGAEVETVRYSYAKWSRGGQDRYVLIPESVKIADGAMPERVRALFKKLVGAKRGSYGDARLAFKKDAEKTGVVYVYLDKAKAQYHPIVMAETVFTFTENGANKVVFPKVAAQGWTRADVPQPAYVLTVPLWQALPPEPLGGALVQVPGGQLLSSQDAIEKMRAGDQALIDAMWTYVKKGPPQASLAAVKAAPALGLKDLEDRVIPVLDLANVELRTAAVDALDGRDNDKVNVALRTVMDKDPDAGLRDRAAKILSGSKDPKFAVAAQYHALKSKDPKVVVAATEALAKSKQAEARDRLVTIMGHENAEVRASVIAALLARGDDDAVVAALADEKQPLPGRIEAAKALATGKDKGAAHAGLMFLAVNGKGDDSAGAAARLAEHDKPETYEALGKAVKHPEPATRRAAASALARLGDTKGLDLLAAADVDDAESGEAIMAGIRGIYAKQDLDSVLRATRQKNPVLKRAAVATLGTLVKTKQGKRYKQRIIETLQPLAKSKDDDIRAAAARSFADIGSKTVRAEMMALAVDDSIEVKRAAARGLRAFPGPETTKHLLGYMKSDDPALLANSMETLGLLESREALDPIIARLNEKNVQVRRAATAALVQIGGTLDQRKPLLSFFSERVFDKDAQVRLTAVEGLQLVDDPRVVTAMAALLQDPDLGVRKATLKAMAATGDGSAVEAIAGGLEDDDESVRATAIEALVQLNRKSAAELLTDYAKDEKKAELADAARKAAATLKKSGK